MPEEKQIIEAAAEVVETGLAPAGELAVTYLPAQITDNIDAIAAFVDSKLELYDGTVIDPDDSESLKEARRCMADLNKLKKPIEDERKRIKRDYEAPLKAFEARVKAVTGRIDGARADIKRQVDAADAAFRDNREALLCDEYRAIAGPIADVIPYEALAEDSWLNRSTPERKALDALADRAEEALKGYNALQEMNLAHEQQVLQLYCTTLDMTAALQEESRLADEERRAAEFRAAQEAARMAREQRMAEAFAAERQEQRAETEADAFAPAEMPPVPWGPQPVPAGEPWRREAETQPEPEPVLRWMLHMEFEGTPALARRVADSLRALGITGATIKHVGGRSDG